MAARRPPRRTAPGAEPGHHGQPERRPGQRAAQRDGVRSELGGHVQGDPLRWPSRWWPARACPAPVQQGTREPLVVGPEVEAPVGDAVRFVDDEQAALAEQVRQLGGEARVGEPLGRDEQHIEPVPSGGRPGCAQSSTLVELIVAARSPARSAAVIWSRISASSGDTTSVGPTPGSRSAAVAAQYTADLPQPVAWTTSTRRRSSTSSSTARSWSSRGACVRSGAGGDGPGESGG